MRVAITGASGLVGSALSKSLRQHGREVIPLVRSQPQKGQIHWDPEAGDIDASKLEGVDAVVHLAGEGIAAARWTAAQKAKIKDSRVKGTTLLSQTLSQLKQKPKVFVSSSAIGYYGNRGDESLTESSSSGAGFLADVCKQWEAATSLAVGAGIRVVNLRTGVVLHPEGGALAKMLTPFKMGVGGVVGPGTQYMSWIELGDLVRIIERCLDDSSCSGPINGTAPEPVTNQEFTKALGHTLSRPTIFPMPAFAARLAFGEMADEMLLSSAKVLPAKLQSLGFQFEYPKLTPALEHLLK